MEKVNLTQEMLKENIHYEPKTGLFTRLKAKSNSVKVGDIAGYINKVNGYRAIQINGKIYKAHRLAFLYMTGKFPTDEVDHINHSRDDNRFVNLRKVTRLENLRNQSMYSKNKSGFTGVCWHERDSKWVANIRINGKLKHLGYFKDIDEAIEARKEANIEHGFHGNHGTIN